MKADLHVHSKFSKRPSYWFLKKIGAAESYISSEDIYYRAKQKGMSFVTITDHNAIEGCLEIAHLPDTFISEEVTTYFPDNGCKIHVLALNITEVVHEDIQKVRSNIYDLSAYLKDNDITHVVAHPLFAVNDRMTTDHLEQLLLLFKNFELNGTRDTFQDQVLKDILFRLDKKKMDLLADKHDIEPVGEKPWIKHLTGGSDDHSGNHIASMYTQVGGDGTLDDFLAGINTGKSQGMGVGYHPQKMAHTFYSIAYQYYQSRFNMDRLKNNDSFFAFFDNLLSSSDTKKSKPGREKKLINKRMNESYMNQHSVFSNVCIRTAREILLNDDSYQQIVSGDIKDPHEKSDHCFRFVNQAADEVIVKIGTNLLQKLSNGNIFDVFTLLGACGALYTMLSPYFMGYTLFTKDRQFCRQSVNALFPETAKSDALKVGHFTDTLTDVNGVAKTLRLQAKIAAMTGKSLDMITCGPEKSEQHLTTFPAIGAIEVPEYSELKLYFPSLLKMIDYSYEKGFNRIHIATPGPLGLAALVTARILKIPVYGTYHTSFPQYVLKLTGDYTLEDLMWKYMAWFYNQMDIVFVPSMATGEELAERGIQRDKIKFYHRGIDTKGFHPSKRNGFYRKGYLMKDTDFKLLYVGRVSKEKNVDQLVPIFKNVFESNKKARLVIVGDGPYLEIMKNDLKGYPVVFSGFLKGEELQAAYASSDIFIFPSTTDTFGNVVLEAQSSGIPVIVTDRGGPQENMVPEETGYIVKENDVDGFVERINQLLDSPFQLNRMKVSARRYMENRSFEAAFDDLWDMYQDPVTLNPGEMPFGFKAAN